MLSGRRIAVLTGAGISTDSGIPDYRGEGAPVRTPMTFQQFASDAASRRRYWAGSHRGWTRFRAAQPNDGHRALAQLEAAGIVGGVVTQNVDGLHTRAGSRRVVALHGTMDRVVCLECGQVFARPAIAERLERANPALAEPEPAIMAPDGDAEVASAAGFAVPVCTVCGGMLKPDVVFFGELVPRSRFASAAALVTGCGALLVAGSSLVVNSGVRIVEQARREGKPVVIVNRGRTRLDARATVRLDAGTSPTLAALARLLPGRSPRPTIP